MTQPAYTTGALAQLLGAELSGPADLQLTRFDTIDDADEHALTFIRSRRYAHRWADSKAGAAIVTRGLDVTGHDPGSRALLIVEDADLAIIALLDIARQLQPNHRPPAGVADTARVDPNATLGERVRVGAGAVVGPGCTVADHAVLHPGVVLGANVSVGARTTLHPNAVVYDGCVIGADTIVHANATIGSDGFGFRQADGLHVKVPHIGNVVVGDHVEIGANTTIDRAKFGSTTVGDGTKIDNLVQIAHGCRIGRGCILCGKVGLAGSVTLHDGVMLGGGSSVSDGRTLGAGASISAGSGVMRDVPPGETWVGLPAQSGREGMANYAAFRTLSKDMRQLKSALLHNQP